MKTKVLTDENFCFMPYKHLVNRHKTCTRCQLTFLVDYIPSY